MKKTLNKTEVEVIRGDITDLKVESFVFYAEPGLKLGTGFGGAIAQRGGKTIQQELNKIGKLKTTESVVTEAGKLNAKYIVHSVGPRFQEEDEENKLKQTIISGLDAAAEKGIKEIVFPPMGRGFYGIPLETSAKVMYSTFSDYFTKNSSIERVVICLYDTKDVQVFENQLSGL